MDCSESNAVNISIRNLIDINKMGGFLELGFKNKTTRN
jgi:hypothetical protein